MGWLKNGFAKATNFVTNHDSFGKKITFTYKNSVIYQTFFGGAVSLTISLMTLVYFIYILTKMSKGGYSQVSETTIDAIDKHKFHNFEEKGFEFALISTLPIEDLLDDSIYISQLTVYSFDRDANGTLVSSGTPTPVNLVK